MGSIGISFHDAYKVNFAMAEWSRAITITSHMPNSGPRR